uniref:hypothetical protein n=1 Tax=Olsenella uli TaxID=133926 RepID=UPI0028E2E1E8|nr:hypothetical protein [Olsenella uli]
MLSRKVPHARLIARQIDDVRAAIDAGNLLSALALALTFPDVLGQVMYSNAGKKHDGRNIGVRYAKWFDEYVGAEYRAPEEPGSRELKSYFTGRMCWKLRCAYLHEGKSDNKYPYDPSDDQEGLEHDFELELALHACDAIGDMTESTRPNLVKRHVRIDIGKLCTCLCDAAEICLHDNAGRFIDNTSDLLDLPHFVELYGLDSR